MDNKIFGLTFAAVLASALLFFGVANAGALAVDTWLFPVEEFGDNTFIGTTDVSNMEKPMAKNLFAGHVDSWQAAAELNVTYQDATANYPLDSAEILLDETIVQAQDGIPNNFVYQLAPETTAAFLAQYFPAVDFTKTDVENITAQLETALAGGQSQTRVTISSNTLEAGREIVSEAVMPHDLTSENAMLVINALNGIELEAGSQFSFLDFMKELVLTDVTDAELTQIASVIYAAVLQTNFTVEERSIGAEAPAVIPLGREAAINRPLGIDLVFTNPNKSSFTLNLSLDGKSLSATLTGYPLVYDYSIQTSGEETVEPRLIKQYSAFVTSGTKIGEEGRDGVRVNVLRSIIADGEELDLQQISTDFYPPVHRVEIYPLAAAAETAPEAGTPAPVQGDPDFVDENGDGVHDLPVAAPGSGQSGTDADSANGTNGSNGSSASPGDPAKPGSGGTTGTQPNTTPDSKTDTKTDAKTDAKTDGKSESTTPGPKEKTAPVYDKGGNLINP